MVVGVASQFVLLLDEFIQVFVRENFAGRCLLPISPKEA